MALSAVFGQATLFAWGSCSAQRPRRQGNAHDKLQAARGRQKGSWIAAASQPAEDVKPVPPAMLSTFNSAEQLAEEARWVASMVECWLNEEWPAAELLEVHADLSAAVGQAYQRLRQQEGMEEMGDLVLSLAAELLQLDFGPTFTSAFDVSNKVVELLMLRGGCDVCCTSESDRNAIARYEAQLAARQQAM